MGASVSAGSDEGFDTIVLTSPDGRLAASFVPSLNMTCSSLVHDRVDLLYRRAGLAVYADKAKTCAIPLLHPWANRIGADRFEIAGRCVTLGELSPRLARDANGLANHGLLGGRTAWEIVDRRADEHAASIRARFRFDDDELLASFPFPHTVEVAATLRGGALEITTSLTPAPGESVPVSFGWHPYFALPSPREQWVLTMPVRTHVALDERMLPTGDFAQVSFPGEPLGGRTFDDLFTGIEAPRTFVLEDSERRLEIEVDEGYPFVQVWAPDASPFLCIEPMTASVNALADPRFPPRLVTAPDAFRATFTIRVRGTTPRPEDVSWGASARAQRRGGGMRARG